VNWATGIVVFVIIWWCVLFMVLPWGVRPPDQPEVGHADSAPERPRLILKAAITTAISVLLWTAVYFLVQSDILSFRQAVGT
jgi:predicted secreted protein